MRMEDEAGITQDQTKGENGVKGRTYSCVTLLADNESTFDEGSARIVDAVEDGLRRSN